MTGTQLFFSLLLGATALPFLLFPLAMHLLPQNLGLGGATAALVFVGSGGHVAASFFFYTDPRIRRFMLDAYRTRFVLVPALLIAAMVGLAFFFEGEPMLGYVILAYWIWQTHHYNRQNHGILAFVSRAEGQPVRTRDRVAVTLAGVAAVLGMVTFVTPWRMTVLADYAWHLDVAALAVFACAWIAYLPSLLGDDPRRTPWRSAILLMVMLFYLPLFFFEDAFTAVMTYAIAHGLQYHVFMAFVAGSPRETRTRAVASLVTWTLVGGLFLDLSLRQQLWGEFGAVLYAAGLGVTMWHFVLDAGVWRLSEPTQRAYMAERFPFL